MNKDKILLITKVKNEADIIEYFIRYHLNIVDTIVVIDNGSVDGTYEIINSLISEGHDIRFVNDGYSDFDAYRLANQYTEKYIRETNADYVVFVDADEFLATEDGSNPRDIICEMDKNSMHLTYWKTFLYRQDVDVFSFDKFQSYRDESFESFTKIIAPAKLLLDKNIIITAGNHSFKCDEDISVITNRKLKFLHFPIRSMKQYKKQIMVNCIGMMTNANLETQTGSHWKQMFAASNNEIDLAELSNHYGFYEESSEINGSYNDIFNTYENIRYEELINKNFDNVLLKILEIQALKIKKEKFTKNSSNKKKLAIYGTGKHCDNMLSRINYNKYDIAFFIDSDKEKQFLCYKNNIIISPDKIRFFDFDMLIIATENYASEIRKTIKKVIPYWDNSKVKIIDEFVIEGYREGI